MIFALVVLALAALPLVMTLLNVRLITTPPLPTTRPAVAILIPARNEERAIGRCVEAALANVQADIEVIVLDDASTDRTSEVVRAIALRDSRLTLAQAPPLPPGWNGKQHACSVLASLTDKPFLLFLDADVVLQPEAAARLASAKGVDLVSGVPRQEMGGALERMVVPIINALLLGYLPVGMMRRSRQVGLAAGCGQMMMVRAEAYHRTGGHAGIRRSLHDGLKLPRLFRAAGLRTDLVNGAALATCRMYQSPAALWTGFLKNATEGMAKPIALPIWTVLLFGGHVLPWLLLAVDLVSGVSWPVTGVTALACVLPLVARTIQSRVAGEPLSTVPLHPLGILVTLAIQWTALARRRFGRPTEWRGRAYLAEN
ncbi:glycosyltransferase [Lichenihabitans psoromatis]|uniref:glycosyltransferase n=1 Tax=Lichenihabitans psoromatis TaxID=2528642 RepID=UPI001FE03DEA|nr:glycosyltransferase [Lichenihabitans psoromatis]